jgi:2,3-bisphosphoglycerate-dependent phosphoglycerate mutase
MNQMAALGWPKELVLVRHGQSHRNVRRAAAFQAEVDEYDDGIRDMDSPLTDFGREQSIRVGKFLAPRFRFYRIFVSPYLRAFETAQLVRLQLPREVPLRLEERVRERELGIIEGLTRSGIAKKYPNELVRMDRDGRYYYRPPGGESYPDVALRVHSFLGSIRQNFPNRSILVITHSLAMWCFRRVIERKSEDVLVADLKNPEQHIDNCSVLWYSRRSNRLALQVSPSPKPTPKLM